jgi:hypothetical protein
MARGNRGGHSGAWQFKLVGGQGRNARCGHCNLSVNIGLLPVLAILMFSISIINEHQHQQSIY